MYNYLTKKDRIIIEYELQQQNSIRGIARKIDRPKSTVAYEIKKVKGYRYMSGDAQKITDNNLKKRGSKLTASLHCELLDHINNNYDKKDMPLKKIVQQ